MGAVKGGKGRNVGKHWQWNGTVTMKAKRKSVFHYTERELELIREHPHLLGHIIGKDRLAELHSLWIRYCWESNEHCALQAHRGAFKTTAITMVGAIWWMLFHPDDRIAIVRKTFSDAAKVVAAIAQSMDLPEVRALFEFAHGMAPVATRRRDGQLTYNFKRTVTPEGSITAHGIDGSLTGTHYDKVLCDDFVTLKDRISRAEREYTKEIIREIDTNIIDPGKGVSYIGTPWATDDAWTILNMEIVKFDVYLCNLLTAVEIEKKRKSTTPFLFAANYELELISDKGALFGEPQYTKWQPKRAGVYAHLDAAFDGDHTCALTIMSKLATDDNVRRFQAAGFSYGGNVKDWIPTVVKLCKKYMVETLYIETNPDKGYTADKLRGKGVVVKDYTEKQNKHIKITTYLYDDWNNITWDENSDPEYLEQIVDYRQGQEPDDAPDSAASLMRAKFVPIKVGHTALYSW